MDAGVQLWCRWLPAACLLLAALGLGLRLARALARPGLGEPPPPGLRPSLRGLRRAGPLHWLAWLGLHLGLPLLPLRHLGLIWPVLLDPGAWWRPLLDLGGPLCAASVYGLLLRRLATPILRRLGRPADLLWPLALLAVLASGLWLTRVAAGESPVGLARPLHWFLGWGLVALWPWGRLGHGLDLRLGAARAARRNRSPQAPASARTATPAPWDAWTPQEYQAWLLARWDRAGTHRVLGAAARGHSAPPPPGPGRA
mgnify:CR=1 FL=1